MGKQLTKRQRRKANRKTNKKIQSSLDNFHSASKVKTVSKKKPTYISKAECHSGQNLIFKTTEGIEVWAGGKSRQGGWHKMSPPPQLAIGPSETLGAWGTSSKTEVPEGWACEQHLTNTTPPHMFSLDWPDYSIPNVSKEFWYAAIKDIRDNNIKSISTQCAGGHGRTGVQLAILAYLLGTEEERKVWPDASALIVWVRDMHCVHAVEAKSQQEYIAMVCGIPVGNNEIHGGSFGGYAGGYSASNNYGGWNTDPTPNNYKTDTNLNTKEYYDPMIDSHLAIDKGGADYCPYCEVVDFISIDDHCTECGKDPQMFDKEEEVVCIECGFDSLDLGICNHCDYDNDYKEGKVKKLCLSCGTQAHAEHFIDGGTECALCVAKRMKIRTKPISRKVHIQCGRCSEYKPILRIHQVDVAKNDMVCYKCNADDMMKRGQ
jgi:hypothetical protein